MSDNNDVEMIEADGQSPIIRFGEQADLSAATTLKQWLTEKLAAGKSKLVVDLTNVKCFDTTILGVLIGGLRRCHAYSGELAIVCPSVPIRRVFEIAEIDKDFRFFWTVEEAQEALAKAATTA